MGDRLRARRRRQLFCPAKVRLAIGVFCRHSSRVPDDLGETIGQGTGHLARSEEHPRLTADPVDALLERPRTAHDCVDDHERVHAIRLVELQSLAAELPAGATSARRTWTANAFQLAL